VNDWLLFVIALLVPLSGVLAWCWRDAERECKAQQRRAEEAECGLMLSDEEVEAVRRRLAWRERQVVEVQAERAELIRRLLARNYYAIEQHVRRKRSADQ
jgi:uncharacterized membrane-anchored protein YhcB (DUF1043 family)